MDKDYRPLLKSALERSPMLTGPITFVAGRINRYLSLHEVLLLAHEGYTRAKPFEQILSLVDDSLLNELMLLETVRLVCTLQGGQPDEQLTESLTRSAVAGIEVPWDGGVLRYCDPLQTTGEVLTVTDLRDIQAYCSRLDGGSTILPHYVLTSQGFVEVAG